MHGKSVFVTSKCKIHRTLYKRSHSQQQQHPRNSCWSNFYFSRTKCTNTDLRRFSHWMVCFIRSLYSVKVWVHLALYLHIRFTFLKIWAILRPVKAVAETWETDFGILHSWKPTVCGTYKLSVSQRWGPQRLFLTMSTEISGHGLGLELYWQ